MNLTSSESAVRALVVSDDPLTIRQISEPLRELTATTEVCTDVPSAIRLVNTRKFETVVVDLKIGEESRAGQFWNECAFHPPTTQRWRSRSQTARNNRRWHLRQAATSFWNGRFQPSPLAKHSKLHMVSSSAKVSATSVVRFQSPLLSASRMRERFAVKRSTSAKEAWQ